MTSGRYKREDDAVQTRLTTPTQQLKQQLCKNMQTKGILPWPYSSQDYITTAAGSANSVAAEATTAMAESMSKTKAIQA